MFQDGSDKHPKLKRRRQVLRPVREHTSQQQGRPSSRTRSPDILEQTHRLWRARTPTIKAVLHLHAIPSAGRSGTKSLKRARRPIERLPSRPLDRQPTGRDVLQEEKCGLPPPTPSPQQSGLMKRHGPETYRPMRTIYAKRGRRRVDVNLSFRNFRSFPFTPERFHVLLNSLFKVLFNFPSRYLFAIGLVVVFSLRWSLPPAWGCTLKQPDSEERPTLPRVRSYGPGTLCGRWPHSRWTWTRHTVYRDNRTLPNTTFPGDLRPWDSVLGSSRFARSY